MFLADRLSGNGATAHENKITRQRSDFKWFKWCAVRDNIAKISTPTRIAVGSEFVVLQGAQCSSLLESFLVIMMMRKVVEGLNIIACVRVITNTIYSVTVEVFEHVGGGFVVLMMGGQVVGCHKGERRGESWSCTLVQPIDRTDDLLVDLGAMFEVRIMRVGRWNRIDGVARSIRCHSGYWVHFVNAKGVRSEFGKCRLAEMNGNVAIGEALPSKCGAKKVVDIAHEVDLDAGCQFFEEQFFLLGARREEYKIIHVKINMDLLAFSRWGRSVVCFEYSRVKTRVMR